MRRTNCQEAFPRFCFLQRNIALLVIILCLCAKTEMYGDETSRGPLASIGNGIRVRAETADALFGTVAKWELSTVSNRVLVTVWVEESQTLLRSRIKMQRIVESSTTLQFGCHDDSSTDDVVVGMRLATDKKSITKVVKSEKGKVRRLVLEFDTALDTEIPYNQVVSLAALRFPNSSTRDVYLVKIRIEPMVSRGSNMKESVP
ncbi:MAG: hypothetical protein ACTHLW_00800 [Verrucomicrobiota bacterium]